MAIGRAVETFLSKLKTGARRMENVNNKHFPRLIVAAGVTSMAAAALAMPSFGEWTAPVSVEQLPGSASDINGASIDGCASLSPDGLMLAFNSFRTGNQQIYISERPSDTQSFGSPAMLPQPVNSPSIESCPTLTAGKRLYFTSTRSGAGDLYVSRLGPKGWSAPVALGASVNTPNNTEESVTFYEDDEGREVMLFSRRPPGPFTGVGGKIYMSVDGAPATLVQGGPHSSSSDNRPSVTQDGKTLFWDSLRSGTLGSNDIWYATRSRLSDPFGQAIQLANVNSAQSETRPHVSRNGQLMVISSERTGGEGLSDIYLSERDKMPGGQ